MLIKFDLSSIPTGATINSAQMSLYTYKLVESCVNSSLTTFQGTKEVYNIEQPWLENTVKYRNQPTVSANKITECIKKDVPAWEDYDVTTTITEIYRNQGTNYGFLIKCIENGVGIVMRSSEYSVQTYRPKLTITYEPASSRTTHQVKGKILSAKEYKVVVFNTQGKKLSSFIMNDINKLYTMLPAGVNIVSVNDYKMKIIKQR